ncbi:MAG: DNA polymerase III subunit epsilon, partial [Boseongicola sp. SB0662_bin_57]|nr:DNA polymerase III subunit epsilon [Boseongicola sp. SB0662_bin_57]
MAKLDKEQRKTRKDARFRERVEQRRANGSDVVAYALINSRA